MAREAPTNATMIDVASLMDVGQRLKQDNQPKDVLLKLLKQAASMLSEVEQSQATISEMNSRQDALDPCQEALVRPALLKHKDKDVRLLVATCVSEVMRILAPQAPYDDDTLKEIFQLLVANFKGLNEVSSPSFARRVHILEMVAKVRSCVMMLDLECDDLILEMANIFFSVISDNHPPNVFSAMNNILAVVFEDSEVISQPLLEVLFTNLLKDRKSVTPAAHRLAVAVIERCKRSQKLEGPEVQRFLTSLMSEEDGDLHEEYHHLLYEIYCCAPKMLLGVLPKLTEELLTDKVDVRMKAVKLVGRMFAHLAWREKESKDVKQHDSREYQQLFSEFIKRFNDVAIEVREGVLEAAKGIVIANPSSPKATEMLEVLAERLLDIDYKVRMVAVKVICDLAKNNAQSVPMATMKAVADRLRDQKVSIRKDTLQKLAEVYQNYCSKSNDGSAGQENLFEWIPSKIIRCVYDKEFRAQGIEMVLTDDLFKPELSVEDRVQHWIAVFQNFDKVDEKALNRVFVQKQRLQQEMQVYLSLRQKVKEEDNPELQKKLQSTFKTIAGAFLDSAKPEEHLQKVHQMKDNNIFKSLSILLDPDTTLEQSRETRDELLKRLADKQHPQYEFLRILATKCSFMLFGKEHVKAALKQIPLQKAAGNSRSLKATLVLLVEIASVFPSLLEGAEKELLELLKESDESVKEGVVHILAKAGGSIRERIAEVGSSVDETLEKLCLEGNRKQAKYAVSAISTVTTDSGLKTLSVLYGRLVDSLDDKAHLPTILQSLGCIAQHAIPVFETRESDIARYVLQNLLKLSSVQSANAWDAPSEECLLKIFGLKMLVKSFLPNRDTHLRETGKLNNLLDIMNKLLEAGEIAEEVKSSAIDKAHIRLAAAKGILRLAGRWDKDIQPDTWLSTMLIAQDPNVNVRQEFIAKVHQYLKERSLPPKYALAFPLGATDANKGFTADAKKYLAEFIESCRREARAKQISLSSQVEGSALTSHPEYLLSYLVHLLAHHPKYPSSAEALAEAASYEPFQRQLHFYLKALLHQDLDSRSEAGKKDEFENIPAILAIFAAIKRAEDAVDATKSGNLYTVCDIGTMMIKELGRKKMFSGVYPGEVPLPNVLYKSPEIEGADGKVDGSHMPACLVDGNGQLKLKFVTIRAGQPSSPRVTKRGRRNVEAHSSEEEAVKEDGDDHASKRSRYIGATQSDKEHVRNAVAVSKPQRGRRKNGPTKAAVKSEQQPDVPPVKKKRGRPRKIPLVVEPPQDVSDAATISMENSPDDGEDAPSSKNAGLSSSKRPSGSQKSGPQGMQSKARLKQSGEASSGRRPRKSSAEATGTASPVKRRLAEGPKETPKAKSPKNADTDTPVQSVKQSTTSSSQKGPALKVKSSQEVGEELEGCRIKVWWPMDKRFYEGTVQQYHPKTKKHKILYDDGDVEQLRMVKERWEFVDEDSTPKKRSTEAPSTPTSSQNNQRGKPKKQSQSQKGSKESEVVGPMEVSRVQSPKTGGKEAMSDSGTHGGGPSQAKSGGSASSDVKQTDAASPLPSSPSNAATTPAPAAASVDPFELDFNETDTDQPLVDKGGGSKHHKGVSRGAHKGSVLDTLKIKRQEPSAAESLSDDKKCGVDGTAAKSGSEVGTAEDEEPLETMRIRRRMVT